ncbi:MAG: photosynthetic reaction center cytochrome PufC [Pseudomonadota bacterium]
MMKASSGFFRSISVAMAALAASALLTGCERPPIDTVQHGFRGTGMVQVYNPRILVPETYKNVVPDAIPAVPSDGPRAKDVYKNVQVLGDVSTAEFTRLMVAISQWVAPNEQCAYCHAPGEDFSSDSMYTKVVARRMIQMTQAINSRWTAHVSQTGVTCYTCHRGNHNPEEVWFRSPLHPQATRALGNDAGQNKASPNVGLSSLPYDALRDYLSSNPKEIRANGTTALPTGNRASIKQAEFTYSLMMHMSDGLGVNCTYCHNTQNFAKWEGAPPQRVTAWHGIRMARDINATYIEPLTSAFPAAKLGPDGDVAKVNCATCHQGAYKPLYGVSMLRDYPQLGRVTGATGATGQAAAPTPGMLGRVLFDTGRSDLSAAAKAEIDKAVKAAMADASVKIALSGFTDRTGNPQANLDLARNRAVAVRDALTAAGVPAARIDMRKPEFVIGGADASSRRVDLVAAR